MCPNSASCSKLCLGKTAGQYSDAFTASQEKIGQTSVRQRALNRSVAFLREPEAFAVRLFGDIERAKRQADLEGNHLGMRLNVLSDLHPRIFKKIIENHPDVSFYDYTKMLNRKVAAYKNYHLTFSRSESNDKDVARAITQGMNVAVVFDAVPERYLGLPVFNGDDSDLRFLDPSPCIVGLKNKGRARLDDTGFVIHAA